MSLIYYEPKKQYIRVNDMKANEKPKKHKEKMLVPTLKRVWQTAKEELRRILRGEDKR